MTRPATVQLGDLTHVDEILAYDHVARAGDAERAAQVHEAASSGGLLVATRGQVVLGHAIVRRHVFFGSDFLDLVYVAESGRRAGIGRLLVGAVRDAAQGRVWTSTNLSNDPMHGLLRTTGWQPAGMLHGLDEGDPEVFYFADREGEDLRVGGP